MTSLLTRRRNPWMPWYDELFGDFWNRTALPAPFVDAESPMSGHPLMDVLDKGDTYEIKVDMPGVKKEDIEITIEGTRVAIAAKTETRTEANEGDKALRTERFTAYARTFQLPVEVSEAGAQAGYDSGVLTLTLAKRVPLVGRRVEVH